MYLLCRCLEQSVNKLLKTTNNYSIWVLEALPHSKQKTDFLPKCHNSFISKLIIMNIKETGLGKPLLFIAALSLIMCLFIDEEQPLTETPWWCLGKKIYISGINYSADLETVQICHLPVEEIAWEHFFDHWTRQRKILMVSFHF